MSRIEFADVDMSGRSTQSASTLIEKLAREKPKDLDSEAVVVEFLRKETQDRVESPQASTSTSKRQLRLQLKECLFDHLHQLQRPDNTSIMRNAT